MSNGTETIVETEVETPVENAVEGAEPIIEEESPASETEEEPTGEEIDSEGEEPPEEPQKPVKKSKTQQRIDELVKEREDAKREADALRKIVIAKQQPDAVEKPKIEETPKKSERPKLEDFEDYDSYYESLADWKAGERVRQEREAIRSELLAEKQKTELETKLNEGRKQYPDFDTVALTVPMTETVTNVVMRSTQTAHLAYYLGKHPEITDKLNRMLDPIDVAVEIGVLLTKLEKNTAVNKIPSDKPTVMPPPVKTMSGTSSTDVDLEKADQRTYEKTRREQDRKT